MRVALLFIVLTVGCGRIDYGLVDAGPDSPRDTLDAGIDGGFDASFDASFDARADGPSDSAVDGGSDGGMGYCAALSSRPFFCDDFDDSVTLGEGWSRVTTMNGGMLALSSAFASSPPTSIEHSFPDQDAGVAVSLLELDLPGTTSFVSVGFDLLVDIRPTLSRIEIEQIVTTVSGVGTFYDDIVIAAGGGDSYHEEHAVSGGPFLQDDVPFATLPIHEWHRFVIELDLAARTDRVTLDGALITEGPTRFPIGPGVVHVQSGIAFASGMLTGCRVYVDNVVIDAR